MNKQQRSSASALKRSVAVLAISLLTGCSLMPTYQRPSAPVAAQWPASAGVNTADGSANATPQAVVNWQSYFSDPALRQLIDTALANNRDLRVALLNIDQARAQLGVRRADQLPTLNAAAAGSRAPGSDGAINSTYSAGLTVTAYELDFFGR
ncbi:MAG: TolC family protein, partial [Rhodoferax sp.]